MHFGQSGPLPHLGNVAEIEPAAAENDDAVAPCRTRSASSDRPSIAVSRWPLVSTRPTLQRISASKASAGSRVMSKAR